MHKSLMFYFDKRLKFLQLKVQTTAIKVFSIPNGTKQIVYLTKRRLNEKEPPNKHK